MTKIGSHDTMTYLTPQCWLLRPFKFMAKCQRVSIEEQYEKYGVKLFDIRVKWNTKTQNWDFAHGAMRFKGKTPDEVFEYLNALNDNIHVRLILEYNKPPKDAETISNMFSTQASKWIEEYKNITFGGFNRKYDWKQLLNAKDFTVNMEQATASTTGKIWDDWFPWLYAYLYNKDIIRIGSDKEWLLIDFVDIR